MDYGMPEKRKSKNDKRAKGRFNKFKRGGSLRSAQLPLREVKDN